MKIVFVDTTMDGWIVGGAHTSLVQLMTGLVGREHEVHFISKGAPLAKSASNILESGAVIHTDFWDDSKFVEEAAPVVAGWINQLSAEVFVISVSPDLGWTVLPHLDPAIATLTIGHNDEETFYEPVRHYKDFLTRAVGVSAEICRHYRDDCGVADERVDWIPYGVQTNDDAPFANDGPLKLIYVGRFDEGQKRISDVVRIIRRLADNALDFTFDLIGDGNEMAMVRRELSDEIASGRVTVHGWLAGPEVLEFMRRSDVFVLASAFEGFCISLIEAMANGCCPVVTDIKSGNKQLVQDGESGFVVPIGDIDAFVDRIKSLAANRTHLFEMRLAAWETGKQYSVRRMVDNYEQCFEKAIADTHSNPRTPDVNFPLMPSCQSKYPLWLRRMKKHLVNSR